MLYTLIVYSCRRTPYPVPSLSLVVSSYVITTTVLTKPSLPSRPTTYSKTGGPNNGCHSALKQQFQVRQARVLGLLFGERGACEVALALLKLKDVLFDRVRHNESLYNDGGGLTDAVHCRRNDCSRLRRSASMRWHIVPVLTFVRTPTEIAW